MKPNSIYQSVIEILDLYSFEVKIEIILKRWAVKNRFAGSSDRRKIRDLIFDILRQKKSCEYAGGGSSGRNLLIGYLKLNNVDLKGALDGSPHGPGKLTSIERDFNVDLSDLDFIYKLDIPGWLVPIIKRSTGDDFSEIVKILRTRSVTQLRVNLKKISREKAIVLLLKDKISAELNLLCSSALDILGGAPNIMRSSAYINGFVELQDAGSQLMSQLITTNNNDKILDLCAGAGGKSLAIACNTNDLAHFYAADVNYERMKDIQTRSKRAGVKIRLLNDVSLMAPYDKIIIDAPCSGSGSWRRDPEGKWLLDKDKLSNYLKTQKKLILQGIGLLRDGGHIVYITCSILDIENEKLINDLMISSKSFKIINKKSILPSLDSDGFFGAVLKKI